MKELKNQRIKVGLLIKMHNEIEVQVRAEHGGFVPSEIYFKTSDAVEDRGGDLMRQQTKILCKSKD